MKDWLKAAITGLVAVLVGLFFWERSKRKTSESLLENLETKEKLNELDKQINNNDANVKTEELKRQELTKSLDKEKNDELDLKELQKFFTDNNNSNK